MLKNTRIRRYSAETIRYADYADDLVLFKNTPTQAESLLGQAVGGISLCVNTYKTEFMSFKQ